MWRFENTFIGVFYVVFSTKYFVHHCSFDKPATDVGPSIVINNITVIWEWTLDGGRHVPRLNLVAITAE